MYTSETQTTPAVELIGGPHCGAIVLWPADDRDKVIELAKRPARYIRESETKALWSGLGSSTLTTDH